MAEHGPTGCYLTQKRCELCGRKARYPICPQCMGEPEPRPTFVNFLPIELAVTEPPKRDPGATLAERTRRRARALALPIGTPRHEVDAAWAERERPPCKLPGCAVGWSTGGWCRRHAKRCKALGLPYTVEPAVLMEAIRGAEVRNAAKARESVKVASAARGKK
jgi:hypothetical protein